MKTALTLSTKSRAVRKYVRLILEAEHWQAKYRERIARFDKIREKAARRHTDAVLAAGALNIVQKKIAEGLLAQARKQLTPVLLLAVSALSVTGCVTAARLSSDPVARRCALAALPEPGSRDEWLRVFGMVAPPLAVYSEITETLKYRECRKEVHQ